MPKTYRSICLTALFALCTPALAMVHPVGDERQQLSLILRQLDALDRVAKSGASFTVDTAGRYRFDYPRLTTDIELIRQGINEYLIPSRAQPRDPPDLTGHYIRAQVSQP